MTEIQKYTAANIAKITDIKEAVHVKEMAEAAEIFYKAQGAWDDAQKMQEYKLRAIKQAGIILLPPGQGGMTEREQQRGLLRGPSGSDYPTGPTKYQQAKEDAGISDGTAKTWQKVARVPEDKFETYFPETEYWLDEFTIAGLMRFAGEWYGRSDIKEWETPQWLFDLLNDEFHFDLDVCANEHNTKCQRYFDADDDGLAQSWDGACWMNPPYGREIKDWMGKAKQEAQNGAIVVCLVPARPDTEWWWENCIEGEIRFIRGRLKWPDSNTASPFPSAVVVLRPNEINEVRWWDVRPE